MNRYAPETVSHRAERAGMGIWTHPITAKSKYSQLDWQAVMNMTQDRFEGALLIAQGEDAIWLAWLRDAFELSHYQSIGFPLDRITSTYPHYFSP